MLVGGGGGPQHLSVSPRPLGFGLLSFGAKGLGPGLDNNLDNCLIKILIFNLMNWSENVSFNNNRAI